MKRLLFIPIILFVSCSPLKRIERIYDKHPDLKPQSSTEIVEKIKTVVKYRDTTIYVNLPGKIDTIWKETIIYKEKGKFYSDTLKASSRFADSWAWVFADKLNLRVSDKDTTLQIRLENAIRETDMLRDRLESTKTVVPVRYVPLIWKITGISGLMLILLLIAYFALKKLF